MYIDTIVAIDERIELIERIEQKTSRSYERAGCSSTESSIRDTTPDIKETEQKEVKSPKKFTNDIEMESYSESGSEGEIKEEKQDYRMRSVVGLVSATAADENHDLRDRLNQFRADAEKFSADPLEFQKLVDNAQGATKAQPSAETNTPNRTDYRPATAKPKLTCNYCSQQHPMNKCRLFLRLSTKQRWNCVKELGSCQNCFTPTWLERTPHRCRHGNCSCGKFHNTTLCAVNNGRSRFTRN